MAAFLLLELPRRWQSFRVGISVQQFEQMKARLGGKPPRTAAASSPPKLHTSRLAQTILGIDPSLRGTGYGIIRAEKSGLGVLAQGNITCPKDWERSHCLAKISQRLRDLLLEHSPDVCVVEGLFFAQNLQTAIIMGEARGAAMAD